MWMQASQAMTSWLQQCPPLPEEKEQNTARVLLSLVKPAALALQMPRGAPTGAFPV